MPSHTLAERRKRHKRTVKEKNVSDIARRRTEKLSADDEFDILTGGPTSHIRTGERKAETARRKRRMRRRKRDG